MALRSVVGLRRSLLETVREVAARMSLGCEVAAPSSAYVVECCAGSQLQQVRWASKKQGGSTQNNKDSLPKYLGVKMYGGERCMSGNIIVRQRGTKFHPGDNVGMGKDHTIFSLVDGNVKFTHDRRKNRTFINVLPLVSGAPVPVETSSL